MIKIDFTEPDTTTWKRWRKDCEAETLALIKSVEEDGEKPVIKKLYRRKSIKPVYFAQDGPFHGKCAYCECPTGGFQHGEMEHFRPKLSVTDEDDTPVMVLAGEEKKRPHPGYYWLAYDAENLLPSCIACNQATVIDGKKVGKHSRFPITGTYAVQATDDLADEHPLLINPLTEDPAEHLKANLRTGVLTAKTERGSACIDLFALNLRDRLPEERLKVVDQVKVMMANLINGDDEAKVRARRQLEDIKSGRASYALAARQALAELINALDLF